MTTDETKTDLTNRLNTHVEALKPLLEAAPNLATTTDPAAGRAWRDKMTLHKDCIARLSYLLARANLGDTIVPAKPQGFRIMHAKN